MLFLPPSEKNLNDSSVGKGKFRCLLYCPSVLSGLKIEYNALEFVRTKVFDAKCFISKKPFERLRLKKPSFCDQFTKACFRSFNICFPRAFNIWFLRLAPVASSGPRRFLYSPEKNILVHDKKMLRNTYIPISRLSNVLEPSAKLKPTLIGSSSFGIFCVCRVRFASATSLVSC